MKFYNLHEGRGGFSLRDAVLTGIQGSQGLFMPEDIPVMKKSFLDNLHEYSLQQISLEIAKLFLEGEVEELAIQNIVNDALNFTIPLVQIDQHIFSLELFHGPTLAFKDIGARFMARLFSYFLNSSQERLHILVATSGDTGSAIAHAFWNVPNIRVSILYPSGRVSFLQEQQFTTLGKNISAIEIEGTFDDCQRLVKQALADTSLEGKVILGSANSINLARLIPQSFYYFHAYAQLLRHRMMHNEPMTAPAAISVPSGNFGNLTAGLMAGRMGLPVRHFIAATNVNDVVPRYLASGQYIPSPTRHTLSNAMDVGNPSNFARMAELFHHSHEAMTRQVIGYSVDDETTRATMRQVYQQYHYLLDPHGAVACSAAWHYLQWYPDADVIFLETAHPAKFINEVEKTLRVKLYIPPLLAEVANRKKQTLRLPANYDKLRDYLLSA